MSGFLLPFGGSSAEHILTPAAPECTAGWHRRAARCLVSLAPAAHWAPCPLVSLLQQTMPACCAGPLALNYFHTQCPGVAGLQEGENEAEWLVDLTTQAREGRLY